MIGKLYDVLVLCINDFCSFRNAIMVQNIGRTQVGHIPRAVAGQLAPLLDRNLVTVEGTMLEGNINITRTSTVISLMFRKAEYSTYRGKTLLACYVCKLCIESIGSS
jgi:hypothetical protein